MMEMLNCFLWRLQVDTYLSSSGSKDAREALEHYLASGAASLKISSKYLPPNINPRVCPNFANHFAVQGGWPSKSPNPLFMLQSQGLVSERVLQYKVIEVDLKAKDLSLIPPLQMNDEVSFRSHPSQQRGGSRPPKIIRTSSSGAVSPKGIMAAFIPPSLSGKRTNERPPSSEGDCNTPSREQSGHRNGLGIPPRVAGIYSPPPVNHGQSLITPSPVTQRASSGKPRTLFTGGNSLPPPNPAVDPSKEDLKCMRDPRTFSICSQLERDHSPREFVDVCRLLVQPAPDQVRHYVMCREPCQSYRKEVYGPLIDAGSTRGIFPSYWAYFQAMLYHDQEDVNRFNSDTFTYAFCHALHQVPSWDCSNAAPRTSAIEGRTFHVYQFIPMLRSRQGYPYLIPSTGLTLQEANDLGYLVLTLFSIIDIGKDLGKCYINTSELGSRLLEWHAIPRHTFIMDVWTAHPACVTYEWFKSLRMLLNIFQKWTIYQRMKADHGCAEFSGGDHTMVSVRMDVAMPGLICGRLSSLITELENWDQHLERQWLQQSGDIDDAQWLRPVPSDHLLQPVAKRPRSNSDEPSAGLCSGSLKRSKKPDAEAEKPAARTKEKPFVSSAPLFLLKKPADVQNPFGDICDRIGNPYFPKWEENGKNHYVCILSCLGPPLHTCDTAACKKKWCKKSVRHHIDPTKHQWKSKPEAFWKPFVEWLRDERVEKHFLPSEEFKQLTPSKSW